jgi:hypothetical protein
VTIGDVENPFECPETRAGCSSSKRHQDAEKHRSGGSVSMEPPSRKITSVDLSSSGMKSSVPKKNKRKNSQIYLIE